MAWVDELIHKCPVCGEQPKLGIDALTKEYMVACMNNCCWNMNRTLNKSWGRAITDWNNNIENAVRRI